MGRVFEMTCEVFEELEQRGVFVPEALEPRLVIYENPHALEPFPAGLFRGPFDELWGEVDGLWVQRAVGHQHHRVAD